MWHPCVNLKKNRNSKHALHRAYSAAGKQTSYTPLKRDLWILAAPFYHPTSSTNSLTSDQNRYHIKTMTQLQRCERYHQ